MDLIKNDKLDEAEAVSKRLYLKKHIQYSDTQNLQPKNVKSDLKSI
jgi:hypothetical protein